MAADEPAFTTPADRAERRRRDTMTEIEEHALAIMAVDGVAGLTVAGVARRMGIKPPSLYKHVESLVAIYDALFRRGQRENLAVLIGATSSAPPGMPAVRAGLEAAARWAVANPVLAQLLFWRPVPGYQPSVDAFAPATEIVAILRTALSQAVADHFLAPDAASDEAMALLATMHFGVISQHLANQPEAGWDDSPWTALHPRVLELFVSAYPPEVARET